MIRSRVIRRRVIAALLLYGFAIGSALFWSDWRIDWTTLGLNLASASAGLAFLHTRWHAREKRAMTPEKIRDTFQ